ncbi:MULTISPECIES: hypothetical protein [Streptomyces]|uniref:hypothetical protein n=1 Tax=Streptomyces TaxID=1883 RepID=UPI0036C1D38E
MDTETPRNGDGEKLCAWCGGEIKQSGVGRSRDYCSRTHREYAYRQRREQRLIAEAVERVKLKAYTRGKRDAEEWAQTYSVSTTGEIPEPPVSPVVETLPPAPMPPQRQERRRPAPTAGRFDAEKCPYCLSSVFGLVDHLPVCSERPDAEGQPDGRPSTEPR